VMHDMNKWEALFGKDDEAPLIPVDPPNTPEDIPPPPPDDHAFVIAIGDGDTFARHETGLRWAWRDGECVMAFSNVENAVDCLRILIRDLSRSATG
jgi:hypothetical protein